MGLDKQTFDHKIVCTVKPVLSGHSKRRPKLVLKTDYHLMQVKRAFCNTFVLHLATICLKDLCFFYFRVAA